MLISWLHHTLIPYAHTVPLGLFSFVAAFLEEAIPPIPGFPVMLMAGSFARIQEYHLWALFLLSIFSATGKTFGAQIIYHLVDKLEDIFVLKFGSFFHLKSGQLEAFGKKLGHGSRDYIILTTLRALPFVPSTLITVGSGLILVPQRLFIITTFFGTIIRDSFYLYLGYMGTLAFERYFHKVGKLQIIITLMVFVIVSTIFFYRYIKNRKTNS